MGRKAQAQWQEPGGVPLNHPFEETGSATVPTSRRRELIPGDGMPIIMTVGWVDLTAENEPRHYPKVPVSLASISHPVRRSHDGES